MSLPWFRLYSDIVDDDKLRILAFEDRWHFVALCALKCDGLLDRPEDPLLERKIAVKLGVQQRELDEIKRRLIEVGLIGEDYQPVKWAKRQYKKPNLPDGESLEGYKGYVYFISDRAFETVKIGFSKNPWARVKDLQTGRPAKLSVVATVRTTEVSEARVHELFSDERQAGEWFEVSDKIQSVVREIKAKRLTDTDAVANYVANYVATTKDTDTDTDTEEDIEPNGSCASGDALKVEHVSQKWNEIASPIGLPCIRDLTPTRRKLVRARIAQYSLEDFVTVFGKIADSPFLRGEKRWRGATFDWAMQAKNFQKIIEGNYDEQPA